ncbi:MAG: hypothetical protein H0X37_19255, partial [Herpetosiphonaceae bacterium]|nr:hypothetical protein [Herpetosiphonaceae bacterium]
MRRIQVIICSVDDQAPDDMLELDCFELPTATIASLKPQLALDELETTTIETGNAILRRLLQVQWDALDERLMAYHRQVAATETTVADGRQPITVATRFGTVELSRRVCYHPVIQSHHVPSNVLLPPHGGMITTRGLQEWACLLPQELPFASVARLLGWQAQEPQLLAATTLRTLVRTHGAIIRQAEHEEAEAWVDRYDLALVDLHVVPHSEPRQHAGWPAELTAAVEAALQAEQPRPPDGVSWADWERVLAARRGETACSTDELRHLGPRVQADEVLLTVDEVLTRRPTPGQFLELRTARITTHAGSRYFSGSGAAFLQLLQVAVTAASGILNSLLVIADGARWIRTFFHTTLAVILSKKMVLDWHHLQQKCIDLSSQICRKKGTKVQLLRRLHRRLWRGDVPGA